MKTKILILIILLISCNSNNVEYSCTKGTIRILNKKRETYHRASDVIKFYLYDGSKAYWCDTNEDTYNFYNIGDTLPTLVITKTIQNN